MGRRHQLFIIGRILGRYRQLCALHNQYLYGEEALERCVDVLKILEHRTNRLPIQQELIAAAKKDDGFWLSQTRDDDKTIQVPFPFITTCLNVGATFRADGDYRGVTAHPFYSAFDEGDNNDGLSASHSIGFKGQH